jgi:hypothetical protein
LRPREIGSAAADGYNNRRVRSGDRSAAAGQGETTAMAFDPYWEWLQIPPDRRPADFYALLGLPPFESDPESIRRASLRRTAEVRRYCLGPRSAEAIRILGELAAAFACLADPIRKPAYDDSLRPVPQAIGSDAPQPRLSGPAAPPVWRPILISERHADESDDEAIAASVAGGRRRRSAHRMRANSWSSRWTSRKRSRRQAAGKKTALLAACCALLASAIAVAAHQKGASTGLVERVASTRVGNLGRERADSPPEPLPPPAPSQFAIAQPKGADAPDHRPADPPVLEEEAAADESEREAMPPAPEILLESVPQVAQVAPAAASKGGGEPARGIPQGADEDEDNPGARPSLKEDLERLNRLEQELEAQEHFDQGVAAIRVDQYLDAVNKFSDAIVAVDYRNPDVAIKAAKQLDGALRVLRDRGYVQDEAVREARNVLKEFRSRMKRAPRPPAGKR